MPWRFYAIAVLVILVRLSFLPQAIQGDDPYYLYGAQHALVEPLHPNRAEYIFQGDLVSMQGHPHPPLNAWILAGLLAIFGDVYEVRFHAVYVLFALLAVRAMWGLALRFSSRPGLATILFALTPALVINASSLETDVPFLSFWLASMLAFFKAREQPRWTIAAILALVAASLMSYQAVVLIPILWLWLWWYARDWKSGWALSLIPGLTIAGFQAFEKATSGTLPAQVLSGYFDTYGLQRLQAKLDNALALTTHLGWMVFLPLVLWALYRDRIALSIAGVAALAAAFHDANPLFWLPFATGVLILVAAVRRLREVRMRFLAAWILVFFAAALVLFFAGSARYLLPIAAPVAMLIAESLPARRRLVATGVAAQAALVLLLAAVNYRHWQGYQRFVQALAPKVENKRVWINAEWGLRFYLEAIGGLPVLRGQAVQPGDVVVSSTLALPVDINIGGATRVVLAEATIDPAIPLRTVCLQCRAGYASAAFGQRAFEVSGAPIDQIKAELLVKRDPTLSYFPMDHPAAGEHILEGVYGLEGPSRWMSQRALFVLKEAADASPLEVSLFVPDTAPASEIRVSVDGKELLRTALKKGSQTITTPAVRGRNVAIQVDRTFRAPGDGRDLGVVLLSLGFVAANQ